MNFSRAWTWHVFGCPPAAVVMGIVVPLLGNGGIWSPANDQTKRGVSFLLFGEWQGKYLFVFSD